MPSLIESDLSSLRAEITFRSVNTTVKEKPNAYLERPLASSEPPESVSIRQGPLAATRLLCTYLVQQANAESHIYLHLFFLKLTCHPILHDNICRILVA